MQLVSLPPEDLGDWQKARAAPKKKEPKGKKNADEEEKDEDEDDENEENDDETAEDGGDEEDHQAKEKYIPRPTAHPRAPLPLPQLQPVYLGNAKNRFSCSQTAPQPSCRHFFDLFPSKNLQKCTA